MISLFLTKILNQINGNGGSKGNIEQLIQDLPKCELHIHIEGSFEPEHAFEKAKLHNVSLGHETAASLRKAYDFHNLQSFLDIYYANANVLRTEQDFHDLMYAYLKKASEQNVKHAEIFFDPETHTDRGIEFKTFMNGFQSAIEKAKKEFGITVYLIMCYLRHLEEKSALQTLEWSLPFKHLIKAVGLDSGEVGNPPEKFKTAFQKSIEAGYLTVAHAGEEGGPDYIWGALKDLKVKRIDHGVQSAKDPKLLEYLKENQIPLTVCPLSNKKLCVYPNLADHNLLKLMDQGLLVGINSDDPAYFGGYMNENFSAVNEALKPSVSQLCQLAKNGFISSFLPKEEVAKYCQQIDALNKKYS